MVYFKSFHALYKLIRPENVNLSKKMKKSAEKIREMFKNDKIY